MFVLSVYAPQGKHNKYNKKKKGKKKPNQPKTQGDLKFKKKEKGNNLSSKKDSKSLRVSVSF